MRMTLPASAGPKKPLIVRTVGESPTATQIVRAARPFLETLGGVVAEERPAVLETDADEDLDYALIDESLATAHPESAGNTPPPPPGVGYAGMAPPWRAHYLNWLATGKGNPPPAFTSLYVASLECRLLEWIALGREHARNFTAFLSLLASASKMPTLGIWDERSHQQLARALLLGRYLIAHVEGWVEQFAAAGVPPALVDHALGIQALFGIPLSESQVAQLPVAWNLSRRPLAPALARLHLADLQRSLGGDPLQWALAEGGEAARLPHPWPTTHRDLRFSLPQPNLRPLLAPRLAEGLAAALGTETASLAPTDAALATAGPLAVGPAMAGNAALPPQAPDTNAALDSAPSQTIGTVVLEFGSARSEFYKMAVLVAQRQKGYSVLLDESRNVVHRVVFRKGHMRGFWTLWGYVSGWSNVRVFVNGKLIDQWRIWPGSKYF